MDIQLILHTYTFHHSNHWLFSRLKGSSNDCVSAYLIPDFDVCPPVQENLDGPEVAIVSSTVDSSPSNLSETQKENK